MVNVAAAGFELGGRVAVRVALGAGFQLINTTITDGESTRDAVWGAGRVSDRCAAS
jgi:hypothetical protein